ncbi:UbiD family decarboxylase [Haladaptatus sp. CMSO5]|uniref:UbiD family decarboxylase n=1 Tax=Haladaptatus sp. CMSO5 TaxID=3120514 RepID=UPI002FCDE301
MARDLRTFLDEVDGEGELAEVTGAHWDGEIGAITELVAEKGGGLGGKALLFDEIGDYPKGSRIVTNLFGSINRSRLALNLEEGITPLGIVDRWRSEYNNYEGIAPTEVDPSTAPILDNTVTGDDVDVSMFPVPHWHKSDGGRYIGTGCTVVTRDPETGWINLGVYRSMIVDDSTVSLWVAPGKDARIQMQKYHERGENCPVALIIGLDPYTWIASTCTARRQESEYDIAGWLMDEAVEIVEMPKTGLPVPANAEIVLEGEIPPLDEKSCVDGPFGEWPGYSTPAHDNTPVIDVTSISHRDDPIILGQPPLKPPSVYTLGVPIRTAGGVWNQLENAGIPGVTGVWSHIIERPQFLVVSIDKQYVGHGKQAGLAAAVVANGAYGGRYVVVVDDDIDITNLEDVIWAMTTRCPADEIEIVDGVYTSPLDPTITDRSQNKASRAIIDATIPYNGDYPSVNKFDDDYREEIAEKWNIDDL